MGLFSSIFKPKQQANTPAARNEIVRLDTATDLVEIEPCQEAGKVYVCDERPLAGIKTGQKFQVIATSKKASIKSGSTGNTLESDSDLFTLVYDGMAFGFSSLRPDTALIQKCFSDGCDVLLTAKKLGMYDKIVPEIAVYVSDGSEAYEIRRKQREDAKREALLARGYSDEAYFSATVGTNAVIAKKIPCGSVMANLRFGEVKKGSSAKPHVIVSVAGSDLFDIGARSQRYKHLAEFVESGESAFPCEIEKRKSDSGELYYSVVVYKSL